ncbi:MAG: hypothetical protein HKP30_05055 [Myxococcales bacterium]|nr:hypothetical protein [Myxococcales bacterium]
MTLRDLAFAAAVSTLGCAAAGPVHPYDQDLAYCRRAAAAPSSMAVGGGTTGGPAFFTGGTTAQSTMAELGTGAGGSMFDDCMRARFAQRFPGEPYPLDVQGRSAAP